MSNSAYCAEHGISEKTYYYWLRKLRQAAVEAANGQLAQGQLVEVDFNSRTEQCGSLSLKYHGAELTVTDETPAEVLRTVLRVLKDL